MKNSIVLIFILSLFGKYLFAQNTSEFEQIKLEKQRLKLRQEIKQINSFLFENKTQKKSTLSGVEDIELRISVRKRLIRVNNEQANFLDNRININQRDIDKYRSELKKLKEEYAVMIQNSYKSKSKQNRLMFIFSSENLLQAYKRLDYIKQYKSFRKKQALKIKNQTLNLQDLNKDLILKKKQKQNLIAENKLVTKNLISEQVTQQKILKSLKIKSLSFEKEINKKQAQASIIDAKIESLIKEAIATSNKKAGKKKSNFFSLTPESKILAENFKSSRGQLPWPVLKGVIVQRYGTQRHPVVKTTKIKSSGISIATESRANARVIFEGEVMSILAFKNSNPTVLIKHGNYITAYKNLSKVFVKKGQKVKSKEELGEIFTNKETGKTILQFSIFIGMKPENPMLWLFQ